MEPTESTLTDSMHCLVAHGEPYLLWGFSARVNESEQGISWEMRLWEEACCQKFAGNGRELSCHPLLVLFWEDLVSPTLSIPFFVEMCFSFWVVSLDRASSVISLDVVEQFWFSFLSLFPLSAWCKSRPPHPSVPPVTSVFAEATLLCLNVSLSTLLAQSLQKIFLAANHTFCLTYATNPFTTLL